MADVEEPAVQTFCLVCPAQRTPVDACAVRCVLRCGSPGPHPDGPHPTSCRNRRSLPTTEPITEVLMEKRSDAGHPFAASAALTTAETVRRGWSTQHTKGS
ncbi:hypothetical protein GCM10018775_24250 [Streptomyces umbrinus]|nr:hypothetical protein GCM10018775_24250 [Streptomyces umbrinus]